MRIVRHGMALVALAAFLGLASRAHAVPPRLDSRAETGWQGAHGRGRAAFVAEDYAGAARAFAEALAQGAPPTVLYEEALSLDRAGAPEAAQRYRRYLELVPDAPNATEVATRVAELERGSHTSLVLEPMAQPEVEYVDLGPRPDVARAQPPVHAGGGPSFVTSFVLLGTTALAGGLGLFFWFDGQSTVDALRASCVQRMGCSQLEIEESSAHTNELVANILGVTAGALAGVTLIAFLVEGSQSSEVEVALTPGGLRLRGMF